MTTIYVYHRDTNEVHAVFHGETMQDCLDQVYDACMFHIDYFGVTTELFGLILLAPTHPNNANYSGF